MISLKRRGIMFVLSSPSGAGKTSIAKEILKDDDDLSLSISSTTRESRAGEISGIDYNFISKTDFQIQINQGSFMEWAKVFNNYYGTPRKSVMEKLSLGQDVLFDIDWQGTQQLGDSSSEDIVSIFILPPSKEELIKRLYARAQDSSLEVKSRMSQANNEISHYMEYNYIIINDNLMNSVSEVLAIVKAERLKRKRYTELTEFVKLLRSKM